MVNKVILLGNVGAEPDVRTLESGAKLANIRVATTERYTDKDGNKQEQTEWHSVTLWRGLADVADKYIHKGSQVYVEGRIRNCEYEVNGERRYATVIVADELKLCGNLAKPTESQEPFPL